MIGVTLGAVAVGNLLGGRLADRRPHGGLLALLLAVAGVLMALIPFEVPWLASRYLPEGLGLDASFGLLGRASLVIAVATLGPPLVLLGAATPFFVRSAARDERIGRAAGLVSGTATIGSLVGTWAPVHWLIPSYGSSTTCAIAGAAVALAGGVVWFATRAGRGAGGVGGAVAPLVALMIAIGLAASSDRRVGRPVADGTEVVVELETRYQYARVERADGRTILRLNEGLDSYHSMTVDGELLTGAYFDHYGLFVPFRTGAGDADAPPIEVLVLGHAAGTIARQILALDDAGAVRVTGVEIDGQVAALGHAHFSLPVDERLRVVTDQDARVFLDRTDERFDVIIVDTYADQIYVPFQTCSFEFFSAARARLRPGGVLAANVSGFSAEDAPVVAIRDTASAVFGEVAMLRVRAGRNFVLVATRDGPLPDPRARSHPPALQPLARDASGPGLWRVFPGATGDLVLTDDRSPIEKIADRDLMEKSRLQLRENAAVTDSVAEAPPGVDQKTLWDEAHEAYQLDELDRAQLLLAQAAGHGPHWYTELMQGAVAERSFDYPRALAHYRRSAEIDPTRDATRVDVERLESNLADLDRFRAADQRLGRDLLVGLIGALVSMSIAFRAVLRL